MSVRLLDAPSVVQLVEQIVEDLCMGRSVLLITPVTQPLHEIRDAISKKVLKKDRSFQEIDVANQPANTNYKGGLAYLSDILQLNPAPGTLEELMLHAACPEVMFLNQVEGLTPQGRQVWLRLFEKWARHLKGILDTHQHSIDRALCLCVPVTALPGEVPVPDVTLSVRWWWEVPSSLEVRLLCRMQNQAYTLEANWREHVLPSLVGNDVELLDWLWDVVMQPVGTITDCLRQFAAQRNWAQHVPQWKKKLQVQSLPKVSGYGRVAPPEAWRCFWDHGALCSTPEYGLEIHTAALAILHRHKEVEQRIWRGQTSLLLPLLDSIRLDLCEHLTRRYGDDWPLRWAKPKDEQELELVRETPMATQWGHLLEAISNSPDRSRLLKERRIATLGRKIRNELAHYRPIQFSEFSSFRGDWARFENGAR